MIPHRRQPVYVINSYSRSCFIHHPISLSDGPYATHKVLHTATPTIILNCDPLKTINNTYYLFNAAIKIKYQSKGYYFSF